MASHLLWHLAEHQVEIGELTYTDKNGKSKQVLTGQALRLLLTLCHHANDLEREVWTSQNTMKAETGLNDGRAIQALLERFVDAGLLVDAGYHHNPNARPSRCFIVTLPGLDPLEPEQEEDPVAHTVAHTDEHTVAHTGMGGTLTKTETKTETKTPPQEQDSLMVVIASLYSRYSLERRISQGFYIHDRAEYLARLHKKVSDPRGELYEIVQSLIVEQPETSPEQLLQALLARTYEVNSKVLQAFLEVSGGKAAVEHHELIISVEKSPVLSHKSEEEPMDNLDSWEYKPSDSYDSPIPRQSTPDEERTEEELMGYQGPYEGEPDDSWNYQFTTV